MVSDPASLDIIHLAHHAAGEPGLWDEVAVLLSRELRAAAVAFLDHNATAGQSDIIHAAGVSQRYRALYRAHFAARNAWLNARRNFAAGQCFTGAELVPNWELARTEFYRQWLRPQSLHHSILSVIFDRAGSAAFLLSLRPLARPPFDAADKQWLASLLPELRCAYELGMRFAANRSRTLIMKDVLEALPEAVFVVDRDGYPMFTNRAAEQLLDRKDGLSLYAGALAAAIGQETRQLMELLQAAIGCGADGPFAGREMLLGRPSGAPPLIVRVAPMAHASIDEQGGASAVALVFVRQADSVDVVQRLCGYYHMTPAEARLAALILRGHSLLAAASELHVSMNTARTHMKRIYLKTATHRQVDLVRLLATGDQPPVDPPQAGGFSAGKPSTPYAQ
jgi:DNA-binding CsgD family transcriptional regulator/PAS domain-containing protein